MPSPSLCFYGVTVRAGIAVLGIKLTLTYQREF